MITPCNAEAVASSSLRFAPAGVASRTKYSQAPTITSDSDEDWRRVKAAAAREWPQRAREVAISARRHEATLPTVATSLEPKLKRLPAKPGVYLFRDAKGKLLYVGKAKSLRPRVRSYFRRSSDTRASIGGMIDRIADLEVIVTGNEVEALHLEQNLVKRHRPPYNVRLRDDKSFPYIAVTVEDEYPRVMFTRERHRRRRVLRAVCEREEGARDARRPQPRVPLPAV